MTEFQKPAVVAEVSQGPGYQQPGVAGVSQGPGYQQPGVYQQPAVVTAVSHGPPTVVPTQVVMPNMRYKAEAGRSVGIAQVVFGSISIICASITAVYFYGFFVYTPLWAGAIYVIAGGLGIASIKRGSCQICGCMTMSIIAALVAPLQIGFQFIVAFTAIALGYWVGYLCIISALVGVAEFITAIVAAVFCCQGSCGGSDVSTGAVVQYNQSGTAMQSVQTVQVHPNPAQQPGYYQPPPQY